MSDGLTRPADETQNLDTEVWKLLQAGKRSEAVALVQQRKGFSRAGAMAHVAAMDTGGAERVQIPSVPGTPGHRGRGIGFGVALLALAGLALAGWLTISGGGTGSQLPDSTEFSFVAQGGVEITASGSAAQGCLAGIS